MSTYQSLELTNGIDAANVLKMCAPDTGAPSVELSVEWLQRRICSMTGYELFLVLLFVWPDHGLVDQIYNWLVDNGFMDELPEDNNGWGHLHLFHSFLSKWAALVEYICQ